MYVKNVRSIGWVKINRQTGMLTGVSTSAAVDDGGFLPPGGAVNGASSRGKQASFTASVSVHYIQPSGRFLSHSAVCFLFVAFVLFDY